MLNPYIAHVTSPSPGKANLYRIYPLGLMCCLSEYPAAGDAAANNYKLASKAWRLVPL